MKEPDWQHLLEMISLREVPAKTRREGADAIEQVRAFRTRHRPWIRQAGVTGFAIGQKRIGSKRHSRTCLVIMVRRKRPQLECRHPIPAKVRFPLYGWIETDVQEFPRLSAHAFVARTRPLRPGSSIGFHLLDSGPGTLGCIVRSTRPNEAGWYLLLSCEHVLYNDLRQRDEINRADGNLARTIEQPAPRLRHGSPRNPIAVLRRAGGIQFMGWINHIDAAVAQLARRIEPGTNNPLRSLPPLRATASARPHQRVRLVGASTESRLGRVLNPNVTTTIWYRGEHAGDPDRAARFTGLVSYDCDSEPGDSGGPVIDAETNDLLGIHVAGEGSRAVFCPIHTIFSILDLRLHVAEP